MEKVTRFGISIEPELLKAFDILIKNKGYTNRSEAIRDIIRERLIQKKIKNKNTEIIGTLTIIYNHHTGNLTNKLLDIQHEYTQKMLSTMHIHIDQHTCLEVVILKGKAGAIKKLANNIKALKGIKHGELSTTNASLEK